MILGCVALLVGVAGVFYFQIADQAERARHPEDMTGVLVRGLDSLEGIQLRVSWSDLEGVAREETGKPGTEAGYWYFHRAPPAVPVTLEVLRHAEGSQDVVHTMPALLTRGGIFEVWLPDGH